MSELLVDAAMFAGVREMTDKGLDSRLARRMALAFRPFYRAAVQGDISEDAYIVFVPAVDGSDRVTLCDGEWDFEQFSADLMRTNTLHVAVRLCDALKDGRAALQGGAHG